MNDTLSNQELLQELERVDREAQAHYLALVLAVGRGEHRDVQAARLALHASNHTPEDFARDVAIVQRRHAASAVLRDEVPELQAAADRAEGESQAAFKEHHALLERLRKEYERQIADSQQMLFATGQAVAGAMKALNAARGAALSTLGDTCHPAIEFEIAELSGQLQPLVEDTCRMLNRQTEYQTDKSKNEQLSSLAESIHAAQVREQAIRTRLAALELERLDPEQVSLGDVPRGDHRPLGPALQRFRVECEGDSSIIPAADKAEAWALFSDHRKQWPSKQQAPRTVTLLD